MAYEYEKENIRKLNSYNVLSGGTNITKPIDEIQEVYRKAKILNKIVNIIKTGRSLNSNIDFEIIVLAIEHELIYLEDK
ncbi:hypothetical protein QI219_03420 [Staphylococcus saprophyticus]|nr:hypothetical protein [Staphylococcus saprophyticus]MDW4257115.1 hypothetical protein [Staphylococcus saprophyticus]